MTRHSAEMAAAEQLALKRGEAVSRAAGAVCGALPPGARPWRGKAVVYGTPQTKGSARGFVNRKTGRVVVTNDNPKAKSWQESLADAMRECKPPLPLREPVSIIIWLYLRRPASHYGTGANRYRLKDSAPARPTVKPDWDKAARVVSDAMTGVWIADDSYIVNAQVIKRYAGEGDEERVEVLAWTTLL